tara:strand:+ start:159 stop:1598 length:1440 start_codon:yes stop_codon:yes gene_type:complete
MPNWKKVILSGSKASLYDITASNLPNETDTSLDIVSIDSDGHFQIATRQDVGGSVSAGTGISGTSTFDIALDEVPNPGFGVASDTTNVLDLGETASLSRSGIGGADKLIIGGEGDGSYKNIEYITKDYSNTNLGHLFKVGSVTHLALDEVSTARKVSVNPDGSDIDFAVYSNGKSTPNMYLEGSTGHVGVGTDSHILTPNTFNVSHTGVDGDGGIMIIRNDTSISTGNFLGGIGFDGRDGNVPSGITQASAYIGAYATQNHSTSNKGGRLVFGVSRKNDNDDTTSYPVLHVQYPNTTANNGRVGINNSSPSYALDVLGNTSSDYVARIRNDNSTNNTTADCLNLIIDGSSTNEGRNFIGFTNNGDFVGAIRRSSTGIAVTLQSDRNLKKDITPTEYSVDDLMKIQIKDFTWKSSGETDTGVIAQELHEILPKSTFAPKEDEHWTVDYTSLIPYLIKSVQDQQKMIGDLQQEIKTLKSQI